jgi:glycosyltransferase involved in cell wall biosynthesis
LHIAVIIPAFNEAGNIAALVKEVDQVIPGAKIVVIDDGSSDNTGQIARSAGAIVLTPPYNIGIGGAVQTGLKLAVIRGRVMITGRRRSAPPSRFPRCWRRWLKVRPMSLSALDSAQGEKRLHQFARRIGIFFLAS